MAIRKINRYAAQWYAARNEGRFWFFYCDGSREQTDYFDAENFRIIVDLLRNEDPVYGDSTGTVLTQYEDVGDEESSWRYLGSASVRLIINRCNCYDSI